MRPRILHGNPADEYYFDEGCFILEMANDAADPALSIARARVGPGVTTQWHCLTGVAERYVMLAGTGLVEVGDRPPEPVSVGDVVVIPPNCRQRITNTGNDNLIFLALCTPRFTPACYEAMDG